MTDNNRIFRRGSPWPAPGELQLTEQKLKDLIELPDGWDGYVGVPVTEEAATTVRRLQVIPRSNGGLDVVLFRNGQELEVSIDPEGRIMCVSFAA